MERIELGPGESMATIRHRRRLEHDCGLVSTVISRKPGIPSKGAIATETGLSVQRVAHCLRRINANDTPYSRVDYGTRRAKDGPYAGQTVLGWWPMRVSAYATVMDQADEHSSLVEMGIRRSRLMRLAFAQGLGTMAAQRVVSSIEARLDVTVEALSETDFEAFEALVLAELE